MTQQPLSTRHPKKDRVLFWVHFITGFGDGLLLPLTATLLLACFTPIALGPVTAGLLITLLGALVFGWARYAGEYNEIRQHHPEHSRSEMERENALLHYIGIEKELIDTMQVDRDQEKEQWRTQLRENGMDWEKLNRSRALSGGLQTAAGFLCAGVLCLAPFFFRFKGGSVDIAGLFSFHYPVLMAWPLLLLAAQGLLRSALVRQNLFTGMLRYVIYGIFIFLSVYLLLRTFQPQP